MADLFTLPELTAYMQQPSVNEQTAELLRELATDLIADAYGGQIIYPAPPRLRRIALEVVKRAYLNPNGYIGETLPDGYSYSRGRGNGRGLDQAGVFLTPDEQQAIAAVGGRSTVRTVQLVQAYYDSEESDGYYWPT